MCFFFRTPLPLMVNDFANIFAELRVVVSLMIWTNLSTTVRLPHWSTSDGIHTQQSDCICKTPPTPRWLPHYDSVGLVGQNNYKHLMSLNKLLCPSHCNTPT